MSKSRSGTVLIIVAGVSALLAMMALTFLARIRSDVNEMRVIVRETQARIMLNAACNYILEASRLGWDTDKSRQVQHMETYGWIDVRDGSLGPRVNTPALLPGNKPHFEGIANLSSTPSDPDGVGNRNFPIGKPVRFQMHVTKRPPFATLQRAAYNPVNWNAPDNGISYLRYPDPLPAIDNGSWGRSVAQPQGNVVANAYSDWATGDSTPVQETVNQAWFRLVREASGASFTVTCGGGGTRGYKSWAEVEADNAEDLFFDDKSLWASLAAQEVRLWYRVEWSPATTAIDLNFLREHEEHTLRMSTMTYRSGGPDNGYAGQMYSPNFGGTIQWIQRLRKEPDVW